MLFRRRKFMGLFEKIKTKYNEHVQARNDACSNLIADINLAIHEKATILSRSSTYNKSEYSILFLCPQGIFYNECCKHPFLFFYQSSLDLLSRIC